MSKTASYLKKCDNHCAAETRHELCQSQSLKLVDTKMTRLEDWTLSHRYVKSRDRTRDCSGQVLEAFPPGKVVPWPPSLVCSRIVAGVRSNPICSHFWYSRLMDWCHSLVFRLGICDSWNTRWYSGAIDSERRYSWQGWKVAKRRSHTGCGRSLSHRSVIWNR